MSGLNVNKVVESLSDSYSKLINNCIPLKTFPSVMLWGAPGVGKSQAVRQIAERLETDTGKKVVVTDVRLLLFNPVDLRGIPTANADKSLAVWLKPKIFEMDASEKIVNILFLDELSAAPQSVQAAAYQIALDHVIGEHKLPDNCIVIAAGNRVTDKSVAFKMPKALANRLLHIDVEGSFKSWKQWAIKKGVNERVIGFLSFREDYLMGFDTSNDDLAFPTPRTWEMVSNILNSIGTDMEVIYPLVKGLIGEGAALEFRSWCAMSDKLPKVDDIFMGKVCDVPKGTDVIYALISSMVVYAREHKDDYEAIGNSIKYSLKLPPDFSAVLLKDYMSIEDDYKMKLMKIPEFNAWMSKRGSLLNGFD